MTRKKRNTRSAAVDGGGSNPECSISGESNFNSLEKGHTAWERGQAGKIRKNSRSDEIKARILSYWNSMSSDRKNDMLTVKIADLRKYFRESNDLIDLLDEALAVFKENGIWQTWICFYCCGRFRSPDLLTQHAAEEHNGVLSPKLQSVLPKHVERELVDMILNCSWKPLDLNDWALILEKQSGREALGSLEKPCSRHNVDNCDICTYDNVEVGDIEKMEFNDSDRTYLLETIHALLKELIKCKCLAASQLSRVIQLAMEELQGLTCGSQLLSAKVDQTPLYICFLGAPKLRYILNYLQEVSVSCGLREIYDTNDSKTCKQDYQVVEKIRFNQDASSLVFIGNHLENLKVSCNDVGNGGSDAATSARVRCENGVILDSNAFLYWLFTGTFLAQLLKSWKCLRDEKDQKSLRIILFLEKEFCCLWDLCEEKHELLGYVEALQDIKNLCLEEGKKTQSATGFVPYTQSYDALLRKRRQELIQIVSGDFKFNQRSEWKAITDVLKDANSSEYVEDDDSITKDSLRQLDSRIEVAIQKMREGVTKEICNLDARIMRIFRNMDHLNHELEVSAFHDFQEIVVPQFKSYVWACLEDLAEQDAIEKSDTARDTLLAELDLDSNRGVGGGVDKSKNLNGGTKDRKKCKKSRKNQDSKVTNKDKLCDQTAEQISLPNARDEDSCFPEIAVPCTDNSDIPSVDNQSLQLQDEEHKSNMELEALEETLQYRRQIDYEAEWKHPTKKCGRAVKSTKEQAEITRTAESGKIEATLENQTRIKYDAKKHKRVSATIWEKAEKKLEPRKTLDFQPQGQFVAKQKYPANQEKRGSTVTRKEDIQTSGEARKVEEPIVYEQRIEDEETQNHPTEQHKLVPKTTAEKVETVVITDVYSRQKGDGKNAIEQRKKGKKSYMQNDGFDKDSKGIAENMENESMLKIGSVNIPFSQIGDLCSGGRQKGRGAEILTDINVTDIYGKSLKNEVGEYECFLNVIIQSLWHIRRFRDEFLQRSSDHVHVGDPCVACALCKIFIAFSTSSSYKGREAVDFASWRDALSNLYYDSNFFKEGQMNDASDVLDATLSCLHRAFSPQVVSVTESVDGDCQNSWDCTNISCIAHSIFGLNVVERLNCHNCGLQSCYRKYTSFFLRINGNVLRKVQLKCPECSIDELLNLVKMNHQPCHPEVFGCGVLNHIQSTLTTSPHVFTVVLEWQKTCEGDKDIARTLALLSADIDIRFLYHGITRNIHRLVSMVCHYGKHFRCFANSREHGQWVIYDNQTVKVVGGWNDVVTMCITDRLLPHVLLFEAVTKEDNDSASLRKNEI